MNIVLKVYTDQLRSSAPKEWLSVWLPGARHLCVTWKPATALEVGVQCVPPLERKKEIASQLSDIRIPRKGDTP
jgi:hypothetical protein